MENFNFYAPTYFEFGKGAESNVGSLVKKFGGTKVLLHYGGGSIKKNGVYDSVVKSLNESQIPFVELGGVYPNPKSGLVYEGIELCRREGVDFILAAGGGSTIDSSKAIALGVPYEGDFWDFFGTGRIVEEALPIGTVLTIAAAGSEGSPNVVITNEKNLMKWSSRGDVLRPKFSVLNPEFTTSLPIYQTACGITDIFVHICERYFTNTKNVEITDRFCEAVMLTLLNEAPKLMADPKNYEARANVMWAGMTAHNNICGVGRSQDWGSHALEHEISALYDCPHGAGLAVICPAWMEYAMAHDVDRFAQFAVRVFGCPMDFGCPENTAREGIRRFRSFLTSIGMPQRLAEFGVKAEDVPGIVEHFLAGNPNKTVGGFIKVGGTEAREIYESCL